MAITINGSGTITGISAGGLPDGSVTAADLAETYLTPTGDGSQLTNLPGGGKVLQVVSSTKTAYQAIDSTSWTDISGLSVTLTPSSTSSKVLILCNLLASHYDNVVMTSGVRLLRNTTEVSTSPYSPESLGNIRYIENSGYATRDIPIQVMDSPSSTSELTYKLQGIVSTTSYFGMYIGAPLLNPSWARYITFTAMEIGA